MLNALVAILYQTADAKAGISAAHGEMWTPETGDAAASGCGDTLTEQVNLLVVGPGENAALCLLAGRV